MSGAMTDHPGVSFVDRVLVLTMTDNRVHSVGRCISYETSPTVVVELPGGRIQSWRADMTTVANATQQIEYWKSRAYAAEGKLGE